MEARLSSVARSAYINVVFQVSRQHLFLILSLSLSHSISARMEINKYIGQTGGPTGAGISLPLSPIVRRQNEYYAISPVLKTIILKGLRKSQQMSIT